MIILFVLSLGGYVGLRFYHELNLDKIAPEITCDKEAIEVSVEDPKEKLLAGVSALDDKDGDLTKEVIVENIGPFMSEGLLEHYSDISEMMYPGYILEELVPAVRRRHDAVQPMREELWRRVSQGRGNRTGHCRGKVVLAGDRCAWKGELGELPV